MRVCFGATPCVLAALALVALAPGTAHGQSYYAFSAVLVPTGTPVGSVARAPLEVLGWDAPERPRVRYADPATVMTSAIALDDPSTRVVVGVGRRARLDTGTAWVAWMAGGAWAPLRRGSASGPEIAVAEDLPFQGAMIAARVPGARGVPERAFVEPEISGRGWLAVCVDANAAGVAHAAPSSDAPRWEVPLEARFRRHARARGWTSYDVRVGAFEVRGYFERDLTLCPGGAPIGILEAATEPWCPVVSTLDARVLPRGTDLFVPGSPSMLLGRTRRELIARRVDERVIELRDGAPSRWVLRAEIRVGVDALETTTGTWVADRDTCLRRPSDWPD